MRVRFPSYLFLSPSFFFLRSLTSRRTPLSERLHEGITATTKKPEGRKRQKCFSAVQFYTSYTAVSRKVVGRNAHATIPKGNMGYDQYTVRND